MKPVAQPPFYAAEIRPAIVCLTSTGLRVDRDMHVLDCADRPIGGLFSAGEVSGGVLGDRYIGGGNSIAKAIVFGRFARSEQASGGDDWVRTCRMRGSPYSSKINNNTSIMR